MLAFIIRRIVWTIPVLLLVILMTFAMMKLIKGNPFQVTDRAGSRVDPAEPRPEVPPRQAVVAAVPLLRSRHGPPRPRAVARAAQPGRQRRHQGALPDLDQARPDGDGLRDHRRDPARGVRRPEAEHGPRLHGDGHREPRLRVTELPRRDPAHLLLLVAAQGLHRVTDERLERPELVGPARDRPRASTR